MPTITSKPNVKVDESILRYMQTEEQRTTIVHCKIYSPFPTLARIWKSTFLVEDGGRKVPLLKAFNIAMAPNWSLFNAEDSFVNFTLLFEGLSKGCSRFQLLEDIAEDGGFFSEDIKRNGTDVYTVNLQF